mmetsp:Transcript_28364/g.59126  ORF Transcript_28364/g.59126 Transcript_28364/m.59126 type:complete len:262 (+) Transcript_28364:1268-2053(+)
MEGRERRMNLTRKHQHRNSNRSHPSNGTPIDPTTSSSRPSESAPWSSPREPQAWTTRRSRAPCSPRRRSARTEGTSPPTPAPPRPSGGSRSENRRSPRGRPSAPSEERRDPSPSFVRGRTCPPSSGIARGITSPPCPPRRVRPPSSSTNSPRRHRSNLLESRREGRPNWLVSTPKSPFSLWRPRSTFECITWSSRSWSSDCFRGVVTSPRWTCIPPEITWWWAAWIDDWCGSISTWHPLRTRRSSITNGHYVAWVSILVIH